MKIEYTYKIINVDKTNKCMEILYESPKYGVLHVGARMPWKGESIEDIVHMYNPSRYWIENDMDTEEVEENTTGLQYAELEIPQTDETDESIELDVSKIVVSKYEVLYALAAMGLLDKADKVIKNSGSLKLINLWGSHSNLPNGSWIERSAEEPTELQGLLGVSAETMDQVFVLASEINLVAPTEPLTDEQIGTFNTEIKIWELKEKLKLTDYTALSDYDGSGTDYTQERQAWREEIRQLQSTISS